MLKYILTSLALASVSASQVTLPDAPDCDIEFPAGVPQGVEIPDEMQDALEAEASRRNQLADKLPMTVFHNGQTYKRVIVEITGDVLNFPSPAHLNGRSQACSALNSAYSTLSTEYASIMADGRVTPTEQASWDAALAAYEQAGSAARQSYYLKVISHSTLSLRAKYVARWRDEGDDGNPVAMQDILWTEGNTNQGNGGYQGPGAQVPFAEWM